MNILHLLSQKQVTGAEVYAVEIANMQISAGHKVIICSDTLNTKTKAHFIKLNLNNRKLANRLHNVIKVRKLIKQRRIQIIHAHSRTAIWVGYFATLCNDCRLISTIHGRQSPRLSKKLFDLYGDTVIAICENLKQQVIQQIKINPAKVIVIPNGIKKPTTTIKPKINEKVLTIAGRGNSLKGERLYEILTKVAPELLTKHKDLTLNIVGAQLKTTDFKILQQIDKLQELFPNRINNLGFITNLPEVIAKSTCIIAAGRIAIESLLLGRPTIALGEAKYAGLVSLNNIKTAMASNFGDIDVNSKYNNIDYSKVIADTNKIIIGKYKQNNKLTQLATNHFDSKLVFNKIMQMYV